MKYLLKKKNITEIITGINYLVIPGVIFVHFMHISIAVIWKNMYHALSFNSLLLAALH